MSVTRKFLLKSIFRPWQQFELYQNLKTAGLGTRSFLILAGFGLAFALTSLIQAASGSFPAVPVILPFSLHNYFVWQALLAVPWFVLSWLLVSFAARLVLAMFGAGSVKFRQLAVLLAMSFFPCLFFLLVPHLLTALFYALGMSQKEWVDLLSEPGWLQAFYFGFIILAVLSGWLALVRSLVQVKWTKNWASLFAASFSFSLWILLLFIFLR